MRTPLSVSTLADLAVSAHRRLSPYRRGVALAIYSGTAAVAYATAYLLRFELSWPDAYTETFLLTLPILLLVRIGNDWIFRLTLGRWRYVGIRDVGRLILATSSGSVVFLLLTALLPLSPGVPRSVIAIEWVLTAYGTAGLWITYRFTYEFLRTRHPREGENGDRVRAIIVGGGEAGSRLVRDMLRSPTPYAPVGFVDDDPMKWGTTLHGVEVIGSIENIASISDDLAVDELIIALPSATPSELRSIVELCHSTGLPHKVLPGIREVLTGNVTVSQLREVKIEDVLGRDPVKLTLPELQREFEGSTVLVTGAAGSIGSELAKQIAIHNPKKLLILDQAESDLYFVDRELRDAYENTEVVPVIGDVLDKDAVARLCADQKPDYIFHAAAYKHVPLMQANPREAVRNNVLGTWHVANAAAEYGATKFVLISTDKAVEPSSVMGATKRVSEVITLACQERFPETWFTAVRFGNVLGSQGSVLPVFKRQLEAGRPLTVTHRDVTRYFMTVSEAVQLVLQASRIADGRGRIVMLEMGEPVRILDLAKTLLQLSGRRYEADETVVFTGLRPGEKLHEELVAPDEVVVPTDVDKVRVIKGNQNIREEDTLVCSVLETAVAMAPELAGLLDIPDPAPSRLERRSSIG